MIVILITGTARLKPGAREAMQQAADRMIAASRAEPGCLDYRYGTDLQDPDVLSFHEVYESDEALMAHFTSPHVAEFMGAMAEFLDGPPAMTKWSAQERTLG